MLFNFNLFIEILAIIVFGGLSAYTLYIILPTSFRSSIEGLNNKFKIAFLRLSFAGTVSTRVNSKTTEVELSDEELNSLLEVVFRETAHSYQISAAYLQSLGLYTESVVRYLEALGITIIS